ncbi:MAG TPA: hypothetical protein VFY29_05445 [Terriglobia bacterium]|nr:hypothetical protein [Terriglobia bacterium]
MRGMVWMLMVGFLAGGLLIAVESSGGQASPAAFRAPRTKDGKPDLNGFWQAINSANWDITPHTAAPGPNTLGELGSIPPGLGIIEGGGQLPYLPEALTKQKENFEKRWKEDPEAKCYLPGVPRVMYMPFPIQIIESPQMIMMISEYKSALRTVFMENHKKAPADSWMGWSNGTWDGETLVIDNTGFNDRSWFDRAGNHHSDSLHVVERITMTDIDHLNYEATIEDPQVFSRSWKISMPLYRRKEKNMEILEYRCVEYAEDLVYGHLYKDPIK